MSSSMLPCLPRHRVFRPRPRRSILASAFALAGAGTALALLAACGQRGPLYIPDTPAAAQRATLPQTIYGGSGGPSAKASAPLPQPALPDARTID